MKHLFVILTILVSISCYAQTDLVKFDCNCIGAKSELDTLNKIYIIDSIILNDTLRCFSFSNDFIPLDFDVFRKTNDTIYYLLDKYSLKFIPLSTFGPDSYFNRDVLFNNPIGDEITEKLFDIKQQTLTLSSEKGCVHCKTIYSFTVDRLLNIKSYSYYDGISSWNCKELKK